MQGGEEWRWSEQDSQFFEQEEAAAPASAAAAAAGRRKIIAGQAKRCRLYQGDYVT